MTPEIKVGDMVGIRTSSGFMKSGKVVAIMNQYCKVWCTDPWNGQSGGHYWTGKLSDVRRSYATPNPRPE